MPQFKIESSFDVVENLKDLGVSAAFGRGDFDKISRDTNLKVTNVKHKAMVEVNTDGTEGAAATIVEVAPLFGSFDIPERIVVDQPFIFMIATPLRSRCYLQAQL